MLLVQKMPIFISFRSEQDLLNDFVEKKETFLRIKKKKKKKNFPNSKKSHFSKGVNPCL